MIREITRSGDKPPASAEGMRLRSIRCALSLEFAVALNVAPAEAEAAIDAAARGHVVDLSPVPIASVA